MNKAKSRVSLVTLGALAIAATLATAQPASAVESASGPLQALELGNEATLDAKGAVVFAPVTVTCAPGSTASVTLKLTQSVATRIATGTAMRDLTCDGTPQLVQMSVVPTDWAFRRGEAIAQASAYACDSTGCSGLADERVITIVR